MAWSGWRLTVGVGVVFFSYGRLDSRANALRLQHPRESILETLLQALVRDHDPHSW